MDSARSFPRSHTARDIQAEQVSWLLEGWLLRKGMHLLAGKQGEGKSYFLAYLAAALSRGRAIDGIGMPPPCRVLYCASEDDGPSILRPRLEQAGADLRYVEVVDSAFPAGDQLELVIASIKEKVKRQKKNRPIVVILDALDSFLAIEDAKDNQQVRASLEALRRCAESMRVAIIGVKHKRKDDNDWSDVYSVAGASAYTEVSRVVWVLKRDEGRSTKSESQVLLEVSKNNYAGIRAGVEFHISSAGISWKGDTGRRLHHLKEESSPQEMAKVRRSAFWERVDTGPQARTYTRGKLVKVGREVGIANATVDKYIAEAVERGWLRRFGKKGAGRYRTTLRTLEASATAEPPLRPTKLPLARQRG